VEIAFLQHADGTRTRLERPVSLGRSSSCDIPLSDTECSRRHALLNPQAGGEVWVVDLGSTNGTYHNGRRLSRPTRLADGDRLALGKCEFTFRGLAAKPARRTTEPGVTQMITQAVIRNERAWLLLADIEGFTPFSQQHPPEEVSRRVGGWLAACSARFEEQQADIQTFLGDGFLAYFPIKAVAPAKFFALLASLRALQGDTSHLPFRLVVHYTDITLGGGAGGGIESVLGPGVNYLFRMEKVAGAAKARVAVTQDALAGWPAPKPATRALPATALKGFDGEHVLYALD
jgi:adenylate cyclase